MRRHRQKKLPATVKLNFVEGSRGRTVRIRKVEVPAVREAVSLHEQASSSVHQQQPSEQTDVGGDASTFTDPLDESGSGTPSINQIVSRGGGRCLTSWGQSPHARHYNYYYIHAENNDCILLRQDNFYGGICPHCPHGSAASG